jgi:transposase
MTIDPVSLARFMVLPGAADLVEAFAAIPDGLLRSTVITHAQAMAQTYNEARAHGAAIPDPLHLAAARAGPAPTQLPAPQSQFSTPRTAVGPPDKAKIRLDTVESQAVRLRLAGKIPGQIASELEVDIDIVTDALKAARRAGVKFKRTPPGQGKSRHQWPTSLDQIPRGPRAQIEKAALRLGISSEEYFARKLRAIELRQQGRTPEAIMDELHVPEHVFWRWIYQARKAGVKVATKLDDVVVAQAQAVEPELQGRPFKALPPVPRRYYPPMNGLTPVSRGSIARAAATRGITASQYDLLRETVIDLRMKNWTIGQIAQEVGEQPHNLKDMIDHARHTLGLEFPVQRRTPAPKLRSDAELQAV